MLRTNGVRVLRMCARVRCVRVCVRRVHSVRRAFVTRSVHARAFDHVRARLIMCESISRSIMSTREKILAWQNEMCEIKNTVYKDLLTEKTANSQRIVELFQKLQSKTSGDDFTLFSSEIDILNERNKALNETYTKGMQKRFKAFARAYPNIFKMFMEGTVDQQTLNHVLNTFEQMERGHMTKTQGVHHGLDYMTDKYNLPNDFFNRDAVDKMHKTK